MLRWKEEILAPGRSGQDIIVTRVTCSNKVEDLIARISRCFGSVLTWHGTTSIAYHWFYDISGLECLPLLPYSGHCKSVDAITAGQAYNSSQ